MCLFCVRVCVCAFFAQFKVNEIGVIFFLFAETGVLNFDSFCKVCIPYLENEDDEALQKELKEAFRLYDKAGTYLFFIHIRLCVLLIDFCTYS